MEYVDTKNLNVQGKERIQKQILQKKMKWLLLHVSQEVKENPDGNGIKCLVDLCYTNHHWIWEVLIQEKLITI